MINPNHELVDTIHCPVCRNVIKLDDLVYVDEMYTIVHQRCGFMQQRIGSGLFSDITQWYPKSEMYACIYLH